MASKARKVANRIWSWGYACASFSIQLFNIVNRSEVSSDSSLSSTEYKEGTIVSQQEMDYGERDYVRPGPSFGYEGDARFGNAASYGIYGQKLSGQAGGQAATASQRLALAIVSLVLLMLLTFGLIGIAIATHAPNWAVFPILFILTLFASAAVIINVVFNRKP